MFIHGGDVYAPEGVIRDGAVLTDGERLLAVGRRDDVARRRSEVEGGGAELDARGGLIVPGFIDLQINGAGGRLLSEEPEPETVRVMARVLPRYGCTAFLPTIVTSTTEVTIAALRAVDAVWAERGDGACVLGAHVEGPFINPARKGVHLPELIRPPSVPELERFVAEGSRHISLLTLAPELPGADDVVAAARRHGIAVSVGHSEADFEQVGRAAELGCTLATHLYNAMAPLGSRAPGTVGAVLALDRLAAGLIADAVHAHPAALRIAARCKGRDGIILVSDAMSPVGTDLTEFFLNGRRVLVRNGRCTTEDGTLAGSVLTMDGAVRTMHRLAGIDLEDAVRMATLNPARAIGLQETKGSLETGKDADVVVLTRELSVAATVVGGRLAYRARD